MRILLIICMAGVSLSAMGQRERVKNQPYVDLYKYHFGFHIGVHVQNLSLFTRNPGEGEEWFVEIPNYTPGLSVGFIADKRISRWFNLRITPTVHLGSKTLWFKTAGSYDIQRVSIYSGYLQLPVDIKYASLRINNYRPYLIGGIYGAWDTGGKIKDKLRTNRGDLGISIGTGCDIYFRQFKLCPELRFSFGLCNVWPTPERHVPETENSWTKTVFKAKSRLITLTFNFE